jgi:hypothetical protein
MSPDRDPKAGRHDDFDADLRALFKSGAAPEPSATQWDRTLESIHRGLARPRVTPVFGTSNRWRRPALVAAALIAAAAILIALVLPTWRSNNTPRDDDRVLVAEFPVTEPEDVEILSVDTADSGAIVVGELPHQKSIVWAEAGDVALQGESPADMHMHSDGDETPMLWAPLTAGGGPAKP